jgi:hypothetical protein
MREHGERGRLFQPGIERAVEPGDDAGDGAIPFV